MGLVILLRALRVSVRSVVPHARPPRHHAPPERSPLVGSTLGTPPRRFRAFNQSGSGGRRPQPTPPLGRSWPLAVTLGWPAAGGWTSCWAAIRHRSAHAVRRRPVRVSHIAVRLYSIGSADFAGVRLLWAGLQLQRPHRSEQILAGGVFVAPVPVYRHVRRHTVEKPARGQKPRAPARVLLQLARTTRFSEISSSNCRNGSANFLRPSAINVASRWAKSTF